MVSVHRSVFALSWHRTKLTFRRRNCALFLLYKRKNENDLIINTSGKSRSARDTIRLDSEWPVRADKHVRE